MSSTSTATSLTIRRAVAGDIGGLARLAALDSAAPLTGDVLVAESSGQPRAAISLHDGRAIADPFLPTSGDVALLRTRAALMHGPAPRGAGRGLRARMRFARA